MKTAQKISKAEKIKIDNQFKSMKKNGKLNKKHNIPRNKDKSWHHKKSRQYGGKNEFLNLFYLFAVVHDWFHKFERAGLIDSEINFGDNHDQSIKETWYYVGEGLTDEAINEFGKKPFVKAMIENQGR